MIARERKRRVIYDYLVLDVRIVSDDDLVLLSRF